MRIPAPSDPSNPVEEVFLSLAATRGARVGVRYAFGTPEA
jgi:hypothetical protein